MSKSDSKWRRSEKYSKELGHEESGRSRSEASRISHCKDNKDACLTLKIPAYWYSYDGVRFPVLGVRICTHTREWREEDSPAVTIAINSTMLALGSLRLGCCMASRSSMRASRSLPSPASSPTMESPPRPSQMYLRRVQRGGERLQHVLLAMPGAKASIYTCFWLSHLHQHLKGIGQLLHVPSATPDAVQTNHACLGPSHPCHIQ